MIHPKNSTRRVRFSAAFVGAIEIRAMRRCRSGYVLCASFGLYRVHGDCSHRARTLEYAMPGSNVGLL